MAIKEPAYHWPTVQQKFQWFAHIWWYLMSPLVIVVLYHAVYSISGAIETTSRMRTNLHYKWRDVWEHWLRTEADSLAAERALAQAEQLAAAAAAPPRSSDEHPSELEAGVCSGQGGTEEEKAEDR